MVLVHHPGLVKFPCIKSVTVAIFICLYKINFNIKHGDNKCELMEKHSTLAKDEDITVVKLIGSIGFQHMELVFVCIEKRAKHEVQISNIHDYFRYEY
jgi:hypothetical protein